MGSLSRDLRYAIRGLAKSPGFTTLAVLTMALGIGATTATYSVVDGVLLHPLPFPDGDRLVEVWRNRTDGRGATSFITVDTLETLREVATVFEALEGYTSQQVVLGAEQPRTLEAARITGGLLALVGIAPARGRHLAADDPHDVVVLRDDLWRQVGAANLSAVDQPVVIDGRTYQVVGVMPATFGFPTAETQVWLPLDWDPATPVVATDFVQSVGRRRPGVSAEQALQQLASITRGLQDQGALTDRWELITEPLNPFASERMSRIRSNQRLRSTLYIMLGAVTFVLLICCANAANLMLTRAATRERETAVRRALGASLFRIGRYLVTETLVLGAVAGMLGAALAVGATRVITTIMPSDLAFQNIVGAVVSGRALAVVICLSLATGLVAGLVPALRSSRTPLATSLSALGRTFTGSRQRLRGSLVVAEIGLSLMLLTGAGLLVHSLINLHQMQPGFDVDRLAVVNPRLPTTRYESAEARFRFLDELSTRLESVPGVQAVAMADSAPPLSGNIYFGSMLLDGALAPVTARENEVLFNLVSPRYFETLGIPLLEGRTFTRRDDHAGDHPAIVTAATARAWWPDRSALGQRFRRENGDEWQTVVGVVGDTRQTDPDAQYGQLRYYQPFPPDRVRTFVRLIVRTEAPAAMLPTIRAEAWEIDARVALVTDTMDQLVRATQARPRFAVWLITAFALVGVLLAAGGIFAVVSYEVSQRTTELGIRMALGATRHDVLRLVLRRSVGLIGGGVVLGLAGAVVVTRLTESLLFEVTALDPPTFIGAVAVLTGVALLATYLPARRATGIEPVVALRAE